MARFASWKIGAVQKRDHSIEKGKSQAGKCLHQSGKEGILGLGSKMTKKKKKKVMTLVQRGRSHVQLITAHTVPCGRPRTRPFTSLPFGTLWRPLPSGTQSEANVSDTSVLPRLYLKLHHWVSCAIHGKVTGQELTQRNPEGLNTPPWSRPARARSPQPLQSPCKEVASQGEKERYLGKIKCQL